MAERIATHFPDIASTIEEDRKRINPHDYEYHRLLKDIVKNGELVNVDRTETGTMKVFGRQIRFNTQKGFPLITTKKVWHEGVFKELLWFISGNQNIQPLVKEGVHIWDEWPYQKWLKATNQELKYPKYTDEWNGKKAEFAENVKNDDKFAKKWGDLGPVYGHQWRYWKGENGKTLDQLQIVIDSIKHNPYSRRHIVTAWNPAEIDKMALPPCHRDFQFNVRGDEETLDIMMSQRSVDTFLGLPFNIASYALLLKMVAQVADKKSGEVIMNLGDSHIYLNHLEQVWRQLDRNSYTPPVVEIDQRIKTIDDFRYEHINLLNYRHHPGIKADISV